MAGWWLTAGVVLIAFSLALRLAGPAFGYDIEVGDMPVAWFVAGYVAAGIVFVCAVPRLIQLSGSQPAGRFSFLLIWVVLAGLVMRAVQFGAEPILEDDYNRYLWDGALTANGLNPFTHSPAHVTEGRNLPAPMAALATAGGPVLERVNYPEYRTVYPPVAQAAFAAAYFIKPFSLDGWRFVLLLADAGVLIMIFTLLRQVGRSPLWASLYWWNPVVVKELFNSAHMEPIVLLPVLAAVSLACAARPLPASAMLAIAAGAKLWPAVLLPGLVRPYLTSPLRLLVYGLVFTIVVGALAWPVVSSGLDSSSGFLAYAQKWQASSALFIIVKWLAGQFHSAFGFETIGPDVIARAIVVAILGAFVLWLNAASPPDNPTWIKRSAATVAVLFLVSPTQFPWYFVWLAAFLPFLPMRGLIAITALIPLHYTFFHFDPRDQAQLYHNGAVWLIWLPVWSLLAWDVARQHIGRKRSEGTTKVQVE